MRHEGEHGLLAFGQGGERIAVATTTRATEASDTDGTIEVTAVDYGFAGLPDRIEPGTRIAMHNNSATEVHEMVAFEIPANETRRAAELVGLPEGELFTHMPGEPSMVLVAPPGEDSIVAFGTGSLAPGRYLVVCSIPTGADVEEFMRQAQDSTGGPPDVPGGPPHFTAGMFAELVVK